MKQIDRSVVLPLLEAYEPLLTSRQSSIMDSYFRFDLSLSEISEIEGISRAGVLDAIHKSIQKLQEYEEKLGFLAYQSSLRTLLELTNQGNQNAYAQLKEKINHGI